jgi:hypothetical protein
MDFIISKEIIIRLKLTEEFLSFAKERNSKKIFKIIRI